MKKGAIFGIVAAFIVIAMLIFIPVMVNNSKVPADAVSTSVSDSAENSDLAPSPGGETYVWDQTETEEEKTDQPSEDTTGTEESESEADTPIEDETTKEPETDAEETTSAATTTKRPDTSEPETDPDETTSAATTTKRPETEEPETDEEETTTAVTTKRPETTEEPETEEEEVTTSARTTSKVEPLDPEKKYVAFTFDDGPHPENSKKITDKLLEYGGKGTFFVVGNLIYGDREKGMQYAYEHGMEIAIHCWSHEWYYTKNPEKYHDEVYKAADAIKNSIGIWPTLMRPPGGNITESQYKSSEFPVIIWDVDSNDWRYKSNKEKSQRENIDIIVNNIMSEVKPGSIILMHEIYENSYLAFCEAIEKLADQGYEFVTVSELLQNPETGYKYYSATYKKG
ncbi:MAG: polysaccharide deacetylase family protein [Clostridia bacterium]|nr:polysaccharide deacetylase family protein [Clostridia bacterium]